MICIYLLLYSQYLRSDHHFYFTFRCVKLLIIRHPLIEADLYRLAATVGLNLERVHPSGKLLRGVSFMFIYLLFFAFKVW